MNDSNPRREVRKKTRRTTGLAILALALATFVVGGCASSGAVDDLNARLDAIDASLASLNNRLDETDERVQAAEDSAASAARRAEMAETNVRAAEERADMAAQKAAAAFDKTVNK
jgi:outer membrane murein-binding lipoprotein Lpp